MDGSFRDCLRILSIMGSEATKAAASLKLNMASPINAGAIAMIAGLIIVPIVSSFTKNSDQAELDKAFECYKK